MGQRSAAWNLALQFVPAVGLLWLFLEPTARSAPPQFLAVSAALCTIGLSLFVGAKASMFRSGRYVSWGCQHMTVWNRRAYRVGYALMFCGIVGGVALAVVWPSSHPVCSSLSSVREMRCQEGRPDKPLSRTTGTDVVPTSNSVRNKLPIRRARRG
jgi:hypothetical protein